MMRVYSLIAFTFTSVFFVRTKVEAFSLSMIAEQQSLAPSRRGFLSITATSVVTAASLQPTVKAEAAAPTIYNLESGVKYAITKDSKESYYPQKGDIVAIEYTGYLSNGVIFDSTHSEGKKNVLLFKLGSPVVNVGVNSMISEMRVQQKAQAIIPPELAFGDKGICLENGECLVKPGATVVYDIYLKKASIPPP
mmetsp:Transcript_24306/g.27193  ORF Transcript_24306/g.27193 Transcript_24306/m.27193 type:complete len:194 (+) Transcript_24306:149-730(+)